MPYGRTSGADVRQPSESMKLIIRVGGSNRKLAKQGASIQSAGIEVRDLGSANLGVHHSNRHWAIEDSPKAREWIKANGATIARKQY